MAAKGNSYARTTLLLIFVANLLPFLGLEVLDWRLPQALYVYWIEIGLFTFFYAVLVLFAQKAPRPDERMIDLVTVRVPFVTSRSGPFQPVNWLPPIYSLNVQYAAGFFLFGLFFWLFSGDLFFVHSDPGFHYNTAESSGVPIDQNLHAIKRHFTIEALGLAVFLFGIRFLVVCREFFSNRRCERFSAPMIAEIPFRIGLFWCFLEVFTTISLPVVVLPLLRDYGIATVTKIWVVTVVLFGKFTMEWASFQAGRPASPDGLIHWLTPEVISDTTIG
ncbi:DUF6498-containing protein [Natrinema sp. 74]|uniref:DUF6498-containing protein n=1 Tax=Natrinema sp. 74 TaxID=3384159 RepID=UPI0038D49EDC